jgi:hypothetical protein
MWQAAASRSFSVGRDDIGRREKGIRTKENRREKREEGQERQEGRRRAGRCFVILYSPFLIPARCRENGES